MEAAAVYTQYRTKDLDIMSLRQSTSTTDNLQQTLATWDVPPVRPGITIPWQIFQRKILASFRFLRTPAARNENRRCSYSTIIPKSARALPLRIIATMTTPPAVAMAPSLSLQGGTIPNSNCCNQINCRQWKMEDQLVQPRQLLPAIHQ